MTTIPSEATSTPEASLNTMAPEFTTTPQLHQKPHLYPQPPGSHNYTAIIRECTVIPQVLQKRRLHHNCTRSHRYTRVKRLHKSYKTVQYNCSGTYWGLRRPPASKSFIFRPKNHTTEQQNGTQNTEQLKRTVLYTRRHSDTAIKPEVAITRQVHRAQLRYAMPQPHHNHVRSHENCTRSFV